MGGFAAGLGSAFGAMGGAGPTYRGYKPGKADIEMAAGQVRGDLRSLYSEDPYAGPGLGYSPQTMEQMDALSTGDLTAEAQNLHDDYAGSAYGTRGREYMSARAGMQRSQRQGAQRNATSLAVANEERKRADLYARMEAARGYRGELVGDYNQYASARYGSDMNRFQNKKARYAATGELIGSVADAYTGGAL